jgi:hypothetical protein
MTYPRGALAVLRSPHPVGRRSRSRQNVLDAEPGRDPHTPAQRAAIGRKRTATEERDQFRFLVATAHLPDDEFAFILPDNRTLFAGMGRHRRTQMHLRWMTEQARRARRTAHEVIAERRLYGGH